MPIDDVKLLISDRDASRTFYSATLAPLGYRLIHDGEGVLASATRDVEDEEPFALQVRSAPNRG